MQRSEQKLKWTVNCVFKIVREKRTKVFTTFCAGIKILFCYEVLQRLSNWKRLLISINAPIIFSCWSRYEFPSQLIAVNEPVQCSGRAVFKSAAKYLKIFPSFWKKYFQRKKKIVSSRTEQPNIWKYFQTFSKRELLSPQPNILLLRNTLWPKLPLDHHLPLSAFKPRWLLCFRPRFE